jgi:3D (Asp-Asp-Asp) domain-containing protein
MYHVSTYSAMKKGTKKDLEKAAITVNKIDIWMPHSDPVFFYIVVVQYVLYHLRI